MVNYLVDVIKNRIQAAPDTNPPRYSGMLDAAKAIYRTDGWRAFFSGFTPCFMRAFPANAACFVGMCIILSFTKNIHLYSLKQTAFELVMHFLPA